MKFKAFRDAIRTFPVFSTSLLGTLTRQPGTLKVQLSQWKKKGLVRCLRKGLYVLGPEERKEEPSFFYLANQIFPPSYVSLESALAHYGLIPEFVRAVTSVTVRKTRRFENDFGLFTYQHILPRAFSGFESRKESGKVSVLIAEPEKAVIDFLYLNLALFSSEDKNVFSQSYRFQNGNMLKPAKLRAHAKKFNAPKLWKVTEFFIQEVLP